MNNNIVVLINQAVTGTRKGLWRLLAPAAVVLSSIYSIDGIAQEEREVLRIDETCSISILNRTVQANEWGRFAMPNVPSFMGEVRARATCVSESGTVTGQTDYFSVVNNESIDVGLFYVYEEERTPVSLSVNFGEEVSLFGQGSTRQLVTLAEYADGSSEDISNQDGLNFTIANTNVASVSADGLVTAVATGESIVTVRKDGVLAIASVTVMDVGDADGDGIPDQIEIENGMDPNDPVDAFEDQDNDGLSALEEYNSGTNMVVADTDGDGIDDGEELIPGADGFITNPRLADTDGDGLNDGLELTVGSSPADGNDANYAALLTGMSVSPESAILFYNTIDSESTLQLTVTGTLTDGSEVDLTSTTRGTTYASGDLNIASFGIEPGRIFAGTDGDVTITVTNGDFTETVLLTVITFNPQSRGYVQVPGTPNNVDEDGGIAYIAGSQGLTLVGVDDPEAPYVISSLDVGSAIDVKVAGGYAYLGVSTGVQIVDINNTATPSLAQSLNIGNVTDLAIDGDTLYVAAGSAGVHLYNISNPLTPTLLSSFGLNATAVDADGDFAVVVDGGNDVVGLSVANRSAPVEVGRATVSGTRQVAVRESHAFLAAHSSNYYAVVDFTTASSPTVITTSRDLIPFDVVLEGNHAFYADQLFSSAIPFVNVTVPNSLLYQGFMNFSQWGDYDCRGIDANFNYAYCTAPRGSSSRLLVGQHRELRDTAGIAPTVTLESPDPNSDLFQNRPYRWRVNASDDVRVAQVNFYINDELVGTDSSQPYSFVYRTPVDATSLTFRAEALDLASNLGTTGTISFDVSPLSVIDELWDGVTIDFFDQDHIASSVTMTSAHFVSNHKLTSVGNFNVGAGVSSVSVEELIVEGDLIVNGGRLVVDSASGITVLGDVRLINGGQLSVSDANSSTRTIFPLKLDVTGTLTIDGTSSIDVSGKGYPARQISGPDWSGSSRYACHGGIRTNGGSRSCIYGDYKRARFGGSSGYESGAATARGGGVVDIIAGAVELEGAIRANGIDGHRSYGGGAGGAIHIATTSLSGAGDFEVTGGGSTSHRAGGGRISVYLDNDADFSGEFITGNTNAGSGTAFIKRSTDQFGELVLDNNGQTAMAYSTPLKNIGEHEIVGAAQVEEGVWRISVADTPWQASDEQYDFGFVGHTVYLDAEATGAKRYVIESNTSSSLVIRTDDNLNGFVGRRLVGVHVFDRIKVRNGAWLDAGQDRLVVVEANTSEVTNGATLSANYIQQNIVDLALASGGGIVSQQPLTVFGLNLVGDGQSTISAPSLTVLNDALIQGESEALTVVFNLSEGLNVQGNLTVDNAILTTPYAGSSNLSIFPLIVDVTGDVTITSTGSIDLTGKGYPANDWGGPDYISGTRSTSHGGERRHHSGRTYGRYEQASFAGSAGNSYQEYLGDGGGFIQLTAANLQLDGVIRASGHSGYQRGGAGGGIHIDVGTLTGESTGLFEANGAGQRNRSSGNGSYSAGAGGRVSVFTDDSSTFIGGYSAASGSGDTAGAGTVFLKDNARLYGRLVVDNNEQVAQRSSTPIRVVGRHTITGAYQATTGVWRLEVDGTPWRASSETLGWGIDGLQVDLNADDLIESLYTIVENTENTFTIHTTDDLLPLVGSTLVGVHTFESLVVAGGASLDVGDDRLHILDSALSQVSANSEILAGSPSDSLVNLVLEKGGRLISAQAIELDAINLDYTEAPTAFSTIIAPRLTVAGDVTLANARLSLGLAEGLYVNGDLSLQGDTVLSAMLSNSSTRTIYPLSIHASGSVSVAELARIDMKGQGYRANDWSGPDYTSGTRESSHGGNRRHESGRAYGRYARARFAGSAGDSYQTYIGHGGGAVEIFAAELVLDGVIDADGHAGYTRGGAGGSVHIEVDSLSGTSTGSIRVVGGTQRNTSSGSAHYSAGAGGRISIYVPDLANSYAGSLFAQSGASDTAGAGTIYVQDPLQAYGHLTVNNGGRDAQTGSTPLQVVGRHLITGVYEATPGVWRVEVSGSPWRPSSDQYFWGLAGIEVDLSADEDTSPTYTVVENSENVLTLHTNDDLLPLLGDELVGVHTFQTLDVDGGASLDLGEDRLVVLDYSQSQIAESGDLTAGNFSESIIRLGEQHNGVIRIAQPVALDTLTIGGGRFYFDGGLSVSGDLSVSGGAFVQAVDLDMSNLTINGATVEASNVNISGDLNIEAGAVLSAPLGSSSTRTVYPLSLAVGGDVVIAETGMIDVTGRGYRANDYSGPDYSAGTRESSHGGNRRHESGRAYGRFERARFAGSAGDSNGTSYPGNGGGFVEIYANSLQVDGIIRANGQSAYTRGAAGGGVHIEVNQLSGLDTASIQANGAGKRYNSAGSTSYTAGAGGRISILVPAANNSFGGAVQAFSHPNDVAGAGTVFVKDPLEAYGHLTVSNNDVVAQLGSTPLRAVGRHVISGVYEASPGVWRVEVTGAPWTASDNDYDWGLDGLEVDLDASEFASPLYSIVSNTTNVLTIHTSDDLLPIVGNELIGVQTFETLNLLGGASLTARGDRIVVRDEINSSVASNTTLEVGDIAQSALSLIGDAGAELIVTGPVNVSALTLDFLGTSTIRFRESVATDHMTVSSGAVYFESGLTLSGDLNLSDSAYVRALDLTLANLDITAATLETNIVNVLGSLSIGADGILTTPYGNSSTRIVYALMLSVAGDISVAETGRIDLDGKGYRANDWSGPDYSAGTRESSHGGNRRHESNRAYGRYDRARFAGSAGDNNGASYPGNGGGFIEIHAGSLALDGTIRANGQSGYTRGGAGGGIHIEVNSFSGLTTGRLQANGAGKRYSSSTSGSYSAGAGGRISLHIPGSSNTFEGEMSASSNSSDTAGAGTIFVKDPLEVYGDLTVDNADNIAQPGSTPLRSVGRHLISSVYEANPGVWRVEVSGHPWTVSTDAAGWGVEGIEVDLDASENASPLYRIVENTTNVLTLHTSDDLSSMLGNELIGVHTFDSLQLLGGASLTTGEDRLVVLNELASNVAGNATLAVGDLSQNLVPLIGEAGGELILRRIPDLANLNLDYLGSSTLRFVEPISTDLMSISSGNVYFDAGLDVSGDLNISGGANVRVIDLSAANLNISEATLETSTVTIAGDVTLGTNGVLSAPYGNYTIRLVYDLSVAAGGTVSVAESAMIDLNGRGYRANDWSGPDYTSATRESSHGGNRRHESGRAYGRYERARFAGSAGDNNGASYPGHGGGFVEIFADALVIDGTVRANGLAGYVRGGAGGGIHIDVDILSGAATGAIQANGAGKRYNSSSSGSYSAGAGGRVSIYAADFSTTFLGTIAAHTSANDPAGAGTVYINDNAQVHGRLIVDNAGYTAQADSTPIRSVGQHLITDVVEVYPGEWLVTVDGTPWQPSNNAFDWGIDGIKLLLDSTNQSLPLYLVGENTENSATIFTFDDLSTYIGSTLVGVHEFASVTESNGASVSFGDDLVIERGVIALINDSDGDGLSDEDEVSFGSDPLLADTDGDFLSDALEFELGSSPVTPVSEDISAYVTGLFTEEQTISIDLETQNDTRSIEVQARVEINGRTFLVDIHDQTYFATIFSSDDENVAVSLGNGDYQFLAAGNATLTASFAGQDLDIALSVSDHNLHNWTSETVALESDRTIAGLLATGATVSGDYVLNIEGDAEFTGSGQTNIAIKQLNVSGNLIIDGENLSLALEEGLSVGGTITLQGNAVLTTPYANADARTLYPLVVQATEIDVQDGSSINLDGKGYPTHHWSGPDYSAGTRQGCHGGKQSDATNFDCSYGRYQRAKYAGSAGYYYNASNRGYGGGFVELKADQITIDGEIRVNGLNGGHYNASHPGGAGGGIHLEAPVVLGEGSLSASGGTNVYNTYRNSPAGAGGRISIHSADNRFTGAFVMDSGASGHVSGAGTTFLASAASANGHLIVDNGGRTAKQGSTPVRTVGRQLITGVAEIETGVWRIVVSGTPWTATDATYDWGLDGISVDLNIADDVSPLYTIDSNTEGTLIIRTTDDLSAYTGAELAGVHTFETIQVLNGASLGFGSDSVVVTDLVNSVIDATSSVTASSINFLGEGRVYLNDYDLAVNNHLDLSDTSHLVFDQPVVGVNLTVSRGTVTFNQGINITGDLRLDSGAQVTAMDIRADDLILDDNVQLTTQSIDIASNLSLTNNSEITIPSANSSTKQLYSLSITAASASIDTTSEIDLDGKGYPSSHWSGPDFSSGTRQGCHGGLQRDSQDCTYGTHTLAQYAGSAGYHYNAANPGHGGGFVELNIDQLHVDGVVKANGLSGGHYNASHTGGAGGGIAINTETFSGEGSIEVMGGRNAYNNYRNSPAGAGGRISVYTTDNLFSGQFRTAAGNSTNTSGAGTAYIHLVGETYGHLYADNGGVTPKQGSTPIRSVGRHEILGVDEVEAGVWRIEVADASWTPSDTTYNWGLGGITVDLDATEEASPLYSIHSNTENTLTIHTTDDLSLTLGQDLVGVHTFESIRVTGRASLSFGQDRLVLLQPLNSRVEALSNLVVGELDSATEAILSSQTYQQGGLLGEYFDTDNFTSGSTDQSYYRVDEQIEFNWGSSAAVHGISGDNDSVIWTGEIDIPESTDYVFSGTANDSLQVTIGGQTVVDASGAYTTDAVALTAGRQAIEVRYTEIDGDAELSLRWTYGTVVEEAIPSSALYYRLPSLEGQIDFSQILSLEVASLENTGEDQMVFKHPVQAQALDITNGEFVFERGLNVSGQLTIGAGAQVRVGDQLQAGDLVMSGGARLLPLTQVSGSNQIQAIVVDVAGTMNIDVDSMVDASGEGYPSSDRSGPDFGTSRAACHGGVRNNTSTNCTYGRYERARFAGSAGYYRNADGPGHGGGLIEISANALVLDGQIRANGSNGGSHTGSRSAGAGGGIHLATAAISGSGRIEARGGNNIYTTSYPAGAGGRISIFTADDQFSGAIVAASGTSGAVSGAGTVFIKDPQATYGHLVVSNEGRNANLDSTPVRQVGQHEVTGVDEVATGEWRIEVSGSPWLVTNSQLGWGIDGLTVDVDLDDELSALYEIVTNTNNTLTVRTGDDLSGIVGNTLVGVHTFETITLAGGASVDFGQDHVVVLDTANSSISSNARLTTGRLEQALIESALQNEAIVELTSATSFASLDLSDVANGRLKGSSITVTGNLTLTNASLALEISESLNVGGDLTLVNTSVSSIRGNTASQQLYPLNLVVAGTLSVDADSTIDVSGQGYLANDTSGPDFSTARAACHGGIRNNTSSDCTYGRIERANFAGSAGVYRNTAGPSHGGGLIDIDAGQLLLEGAILANGLDGGSHNYSRSAAAGGGVHINAGSIAGAGRIEANGGNNIYTTSYPAGAGGRISIYSSDNQFGGSVIAASGASGAVSGAGTVYMRDPLLSHGHLYVSNNGRNAVHGSTPIRQVGRQLISGVDEVAPGQWRVEVEGTPWVRSDNDGDWGITGRLIDLDASENSSAHYAVVSNTENTLTIDTTDDLSGILGNELVGVYIFQTITVEGGASVDFGDDKLLVLDSENSSIASHARVIAGDVEQALIENAVQNDATVELTAPVSFSSLSLSEVSNARIRGSSVSVSGNVDLTNVGLLLELSDGLYVSGDASLTGSVVSSNVGNASSQTIYALNISVAGTLTVDAASAFDVSGDGYPSTDYSGPDFSSSRAACHGGIRNNTSADCTYGHYERAQFAGSAGRYRDASNPAYGGGLVTFDVGSLVLNGQILANGFNGGSHNNSRSAAAGGGVHIEADSMSGDGRIEANGGNNVYSTSYPAGAGGRVSIYTADDQFAGLIQAASGSSGAVSGAGTIFVLDPQLDHGNLVVSNNGRNANKGSTPIREVGRHVISSVDEMESGIWRIEVADTPWQESDAELAWGLAGIEVDLDASESSSALYSIVSNTRNSVIVHTNDDLSGLAGNEMVGVHTFQTITVEGGASVDFGQDHVFVVDAVSSSIATNGRLIAGFVEQSILELALQNSATVELSSELTVAALNLSGVTDGRIRGTSLNVTGDATFTNVSAILELSGGLNVSGDLNLSASTLSSTVGNASSQTINPLLISVDGTLTIDVDSSIDVSGDGYPATDVSGPDFSTSRGACFGGIRGNTTSNCTYGNYERVRFAGSAGRYRDGNNPSHGGGLIDISAGNLVVEGSIVANGLNGGNYNNSRAAGAGGGIHISATVLSGAGSIQANGGNNIYSTSYPTGAGGRISIYTGDNQFSGSVMAASGNSGQVSGAGTVFFKNPQESHGHLYVTNNGRTAASGSTPIRQVGRHLITSAEEVSDDEWVIQVVASPWQASDSELEWGIAGLTVDLDASEQLSAHYTILSNTLNAITVQTTDDLSTVVGNELLGVHTFQTLRAEAGASVDFGQDRVVVLDPENSSIASQARVISGHLSQAFLEGALQDNGTAELTASVSYATLSLAEVNQARIRGADLNVAGDLDMVNANVIFELSGSVSIGGNLDLSTSTMSSSVGNASATTLYPLIVDVTGTVTIGASSSIDVSGDGYPATDYGGPDYTTSRGGCYGGIRNNTSTDCTYGRYERASFAGSAGRYRDGTNTSAGGGLFELSANHLVLNGAILANGLNGGYYNNSRSAAAGGGVHIDADSIVGSGRIEANGGRNIYSTSYPAGAGGRISIFSEDNQFGGSITASSGSSGAVSGAGTIYQLDPQQSNGHLLVTNSGRTANSGSTPIRRVGRHVISSIEEVSPGEWRIAVAETPWQVSDTALGWGLDGIGVDLDASETASPTYRVTSNTENTLTLQTSDDLSGLLGNELVGVHTFQTVNIEEGASVNFGDDMLFVLDAANSSVDASSTLVAGPGSDL